MSVLIKGMSGCEYCAFCEFCGGLTIPDDIYTCNCPSTRGMNITRAIEEGFRHPDCQLVELPEKHGRLVDADALLLDFELAQKSADVDGREYANAFRSAGGELSTEWWAVEDIVKNAKTVIDAEGE